MSLTRDRIPCVIAVNSILINLKKSSILRGKGVKQEKLSCHVYNHTVGKTVAAEPYSFSAF